MLIAQVMLTSNVISSQMWGVYDPRKCENPQTSQTCENSVKIFAYITKLFI